jgi:5-methylcytosine-specific restriction endonuclease McrA
VIPRRVRLDVLDRDDLTCVRCGKPAHLAHYSIHHRKPRGMGGSRDPRINGKANLLLLCGSGTDGCHGHVEAHREWALANGYLLRDVADAPLTPVLTYAGWRLFDDHGGIEAA